MNDNKQAKRLTALYRIAPLLLCLSVWEAATHGHPSRSFFFGSPSTIAKDFIARIEDGTLPRDALVTFVEALSGFLIGNVVGTVVGMSLWFSKLATTISRPYIVVLGSAPIFALAPLLIIWFGTGLISKIAIASLSTVFVALSQSHTGASEVSMEYLLLMKSLGATRILTFRKVIAPSSIAWVTSAFRLNIGFALLGAIIGEFISSNQGLGHMITVASGLFDISVVLLGVACIGLVALIANVIVGMLEGRLMRVVVRFL